MEPAPLDRCGDSDFLRAVQGKDGVEVRRIVDRLMEDLHVINPRVYESVMHKIKAL